MQTEIEVKFLNVNHDELRAKLKELGATLDQPMRLMRRSMFDFPDKRFQESSLNKRLRIRDEGNKITTTCKFRVEADHDFEQEIETTVGSYDSMRELYKAIGLIEDSFQESKRESWHYKEVEIVLDEWPWLNPYIEVEGPSEAAIKEVSEELGFDWSTRQFGSVDTVYRHQYPGMTQSESIGNLSVVKFDLPLPQWLEERK